MMLAKLATPDLLKITVFWIKSYDVILWVYNVINKILLRDSICVVNVAAWPKFGNLSISKKDFVEGWYWFKFNSLELVRSMVLKNYSVVAKVLKLKFKKCWGLILTIGEGRREKLAGASFCPVLNRVESVKRVLRVLRYFLVRIRTEFGDLQSNS